jgi:hypothetical protein
MKIQHNDWNMWELWQIACKKYNFNKSGFNGFIVWIQNNLSTVLLNCINTCSNKGNKPYGWMPPTKGLELSDNNVRLYYCHQVICFQQVVPIW